jgi:UDPglucose 6-dehydrogenase
VVVERSRIFIVGSGVVGTATGRGLADAGHQVSFIDISTERIRQLKEWGLDARDHLDLTGEPSSFIFLTLPTPHLGHKYDLTAFTAGTASVGDALKASDAAHRRGALHRHPRHHRGPGQSRCSRSAPARRSSRASTLASNPEFLRAVSAEKDFRPPVDDRDRLA